MSFHHDRMNPNYQVGVYLPKRSKLVSYTVSKTDDRETIIRHHIPKNLSFLSPKLLFSNSQMTFVNLGLYIISQTIYIAIFISYCLEKERQAAAISG